ncbi:MAG: hypothetical protein ACJ0SL_00915 [Candidatus Rariloculaceae bacterium]
MGHTNKKRCDILVVLMGHLMCYLVIGGLGVLGFLGEHDRRAGENRQHCS